MPDSYNPDEAEASTSEGDSECLIGDGPFFVGRLLKKIAALDDKCRECILVSLFKFC